MGRRTTVGLVQALLGGNYGPVNGVAPSDLGQYLDKATLTINQVVALQTKKTQPCVLTSDDYEMMERWTAAYYYCLYDPLYNSRSTEGASGSFSEEKLDANRYKAGAIQSDPSGVLNALLNRLFASSVNVSGCRDA